MAYYVQRKSLTNWRDEDVAMSNKKLGPFHDEDGARLALEVMLRRESQDWLEYNRGPAHEEIFAHAEELRKAADRVQLEDVTEVIIGKNLQFKIWQW